MGGVSSKVAGVELEYLMGSWEEEEGRRHGSLCLKGGLPCPLGQGDGSSQSSRGEQGTGGQ